MNAYQNTYKGSWRLRLVLIRKLLLRWGWFVALSIILTTYLSSIIPDTQSVSGYQAELQIQVQFLSGNGVNNLDVGTSFFAGILVNPDTLSLALPKLNKLSQFQSIQVNDLASFISAQPVKDANLVLLDAVGDTPQDASILVNTVYQAFLTKVHSERSLVVGGLNSALNLDLVQAETDTANSASTLQSLRATAKTSTSAYLLVQVLHTQQQHRVDAINALLLKLQQQGFGANDILQLVRNAPDITTVPGTGPTQSQRIALSPLVGLIMGLGGVLLASRFTPDLTQRGQKREMNLPESSIAVPRLAKLRGNGLQALEQTSSEFLHLLRRLRYQASEHEKPLQVITVTSPKRGEGKSTVASNLAFTAARSGIRTLLVDANTQQPFIHSWFRVPNTNGTLNAIRLIRADMAGPSPVIDTPVAKFGLIPLGQGSSPTKKDGTSPEEEMPVNALGAFIETLRDQAELVVIDGPSLLSDATAANLVLFSDMILVVADAQKSRSTTVLEARDLLSNMQAPFTFVLNRGEREVAD